MIKELINFTENLDEEFKNLGSTPKEGLHIRIKFLLSESGETSIDTSDIDLQQIKGKAYVRNPNTNISKSKNKNKNNSYYF